MAYTPLVYTPHNYYTIATQSISLNGKRLVVNQVGWVGQLLAAAL